MRTKTKKTVVFKAAPGAPFAKNKAQVIGKRLEQISDEGILTPEQVVEDAEDKKSPLHDLFQWNDGEAAKQYRLSQARNIINHFILVVHEGDKEYETKAWHSVKFVDSEGENQRSYASMEVVQNNEQLREQVVANARRELSYWQRRYAEYKELLPEVRKLARQMANAC